MIQAEFTIYPFIEGEAPPGHVQAAIDEIRARGLEVEVGPLSSTVVGEAEEVLSALAAGQLAAVRAGARRVVISIEVVPG
jgi:uncharacterized protein YqgV (UPF0045/DUF77 family)